MLHRVPFSFLHLSTSSLSEWIRNWRQELDFYVQDRRHLFLLCDPLRIPVCKLFLYLLAFGSWASRNHNVHPFCVVKITRCLRRLFNDEIAGVAVQTWIWTGPLGPSIHWTRRPSLHWTLLQFLNPIQSCCLRANSRSTWFDSVSTLVSSNLSLIKLRSSGKKWAFPAVLSSSDGAVFGLLSCGMSKTSNC